MTKIFAVLLVLVSSIGLLTAGCSKEAPEDSSGGQKLKLAFVAVIAAAALFITSLRGNRGGNAGVWAFRIHAALVVGAMGLLAYYFVAHRFEYEYVASYSSRALSPALALASSWAGQEGSVLLWTMFGALVGVALLRQPGILTRGAMFFVSLMQFFLMLSFNKRDGLLQDW